MTFTGNEDHSISLNDAVSMTTRYRESEGSGFLAGFFGKSAIDSILEQSGCVGIRIYNAMDDEDNRCFVVVGVTSDEKDMYNGELAEFSTGCPPHCAEGSPLAGSE